MGHLWSVEAKSQESLRLALPSRVDTRLRHEYNSARVYNCLISLMFFISFDGSVG